MDGAALATLKAIGTDLRSERYPRFLNEGIVVPGDGVSRIFPPGKENENGNSGTSRSSTRPRKRTTGWQRPPRGATDPTAPVRVEQLEQQLAAQLEALRAAYPDAVVTWQRYGAWVTFSSRILEGIERRARFFVAIPFGLGRVRSWGYWEGTVLRRAWIGPRHTNFPEGSVCAFDPREPSPPGSHDIVALFDIYTLWAFRHLHLEILGTWPGRQVGDFASERMFEFKPEELCGCNSFGRTYDSCCSTQDARNQSPAELVDYALTFAARRVPDEIEAFAHGGPAPPVESLESPAFWGVTLN